MSDLNRSVSSSGGAEKKRPTLADVGNSTKRFARRVRPPYIAMLNGSRLGMRSYVILKRGRMVGRRNRSRSTRNEPVTGECITTGQRLGNKLVRALVELLFNDPESPRSKRTVAEQLAIRCYEKGFEASTVTTPDGPAVYMDSTRQAFERTRSVA